MHNDLWQQLEQQLTQLAGQAVMVDRKFGTMPAADWFDSRLFQTHSPQLLDYVQEAQQVLQRVKAMPSSQAGFRLWVDRLVGQIDALTRAFQSVGLREQEAKRRRGRKKTSVDAPPAVSQQTLQRQRAGELLRQLGGTTHALYEKLAEYHEFERRLLQMTQDAALQQNDVPRQLALHARLGRCRKAIAELEAEIQWVEQRQRQR